MKKSLLLCLGLIIFGLGSLSANEAEIGVYLSTKSKAFHSNGRRYIGMQARRLQKSVSINDLESLAEEGQASEPGYKKVLLALYAEELPSLQAKIDEMKKSSDVILWLISARSDAVASGFDAVSSSSAKPDAMSALDKQILPKLFN